MNIQYLASLDINGKFENFSDGRFNWSRRTQQFGVGGGFLFESLSFSLK